MTPQYGPDYEIANYFLWTNPASHFVHSLIAARAPEGRHLTLLNRTMTLRRLDGTVQCHEFGSAPEVCDALRNEFGVEFDEEATLLERLRPSFSQTAET